jgi:hypothetical protein
MMGFVLDPFVLISFSEKEAKKKRVLHHEWIHVLQMREEGVLKFYCRYFCEWVVNLLSFWNFRKAYRNISYEKEAYSMVKRVRLPRKLK